jgi:hypothetical protein
VGIRQKPRRPAKEQYPMTEATKGSRLPRGRNADRPRADEKQRKHTGADLQNGWLGRHGMLTLTDDRLVFVPTLLDTLLRAKRHEVHLDAITVVQRWPHDPGDIPLGGRRPRMLLHTPECVYEFMVGDLDAWLDSLEKIYELRQKRGLTHLPRFDRAENDNLMTAEE